MSQHKSTPQTRGSTGHSVHIGNSPANAGIDPVRFRADGEHDKSSPANAGIDLPPSWALREAQDDLTHPWRLLAPSGQEIGLETPEDAAPLAWHLEAERLAAGHEPAPHPAPVGLVRALCDLVGGQRAAWRLLHVSSDRTIRGWCSGDHPASHSAVELLRLAAGGRWP